MLHGFRAHRRSRALALIASIFYLATNPAATMLALAKKYAASGAAESGIVPAAHAVLVKFRGTASLAHYMLMGVAGMLVALVMLRSEVFSRTRAVKTLCSARVPPGPWPRFSANLPLMFSESAMMI